MSSSFPKTIYNAVAPSLAMSCYSAAMELLLVLGMLVATAESAAAQQTQQQQQQRNYYAAPEPKKYAVELTTGNLTANLRDWDSDLAIMFYAPWCKYCKQLATTWEQIAILSASNKELVIGKYNCEQPTEHTEVCQKLGVDRYPSVYFMGFGEIHQSPRGNPFGKNPYPRIAYYNADLFPEAIYDWVRSLTWMSSMQRKWYDVKAFVTGKKSRHAVKAEQLKGKVNQLENKLIVYDNALQKYKADEIFNQLKDNGDAFALMYSLEPEERNLPLRVCVGEMAAEYCKYHSDEEKYCLNIAKCQKDYMVNPICRPDVCPFTNSLGCRVASACLQASVLEEYKKVLSTAAAETATATSSTGAAGAASTARARRV